MKRKRGFFIALVAVLVSCALISSISSPLAAQNATQQPAEKSSLKAAGGSQEKPVAKTPPKPPAQIDLLETHIRFEANGDSRKEVHALVKINDEAGARQFARLSFNYNRSFQSIEMPLVRITHGNGGTSDVLPSAITDNPDPAVINFPAYQDVRVKSIRILGLEPGDSLEYRVVTTVSHHPLAPDFWFEHTFDPSGVVSHELLDLAFAASRKPIIRINPATAATSSETERDGDASYNVYRWDRKLPDAGAPDASPNEPDILVSTEQWETLSIRLDERMSFSDQPLRNLGAYEENSSDPPKRLPPSPEIVDKALQLIKGTQGSRAKLGALYDFVSQKIKTVDLPLGSTGFRARPAGEILASGYATQEDKFVLFRELALALKLGATATLTGYCDKKAPASPLGFKRLLISAGDLDKSYFVDPSIEVAPFGVIPPNSGDCTFVLNRLFYVMNSTGHEWQKLEAPLPFPSKQSVAINATLSPEGTLTARAKYAMRGENELLLRVAFHQSPREKWDGVAQLLALSDGFRGKVTKATASDPYDTHHPFEVEYEITQPKFVDWSKKLVRISALLPLLGLPGPPSNAAAGAQPSPIELGTPLDVEVTATIDLPERTGGEVPAGTSVERDFATYSSKYSVNGATLTASRHINFILKEIPADRAAEYIAFLRTVQNDESQFFTLERGNATPPAPPKP